MSAPRIVVGLAFLAGCPGKTTAPPDPPAPTAVAEADVDPQRVFATVAELASDGLGGRYSLHGDIERAARYLADAFDEAGLQPIDGSYLHAFPILVGAEIGDTPQLELTRRGRSMAVETEEFAPLSVSPSANVEGEVVFVGYAAQAEAKGERRAYDDLAGLDLEGKIALVLLDAPARPNPRELYRELRAVRDAYAAKAKPLREAKDRDALKRLRKLTRDELTGLVKPFLKGNALGEVPEALHGEMPLEPFTEPVFAAPADATEPNLSFRDGRLRTKLRRLHAAGAKAAIVVRGPRTLIGDAGDELPPLSGRAASSPAPLPVVQMKWEAADRVLRIGRRKLSQLQAKIDRTLQPQSGPTGATAKLKIDVTPITKDAPNVLAVIPGNGRADETVMLGAHYDHIGTDEDGHGHCRTDDGDAICNGADDNASGTAVVVEVARVLASNGYKPERTLVFALFAGEELGLHGSTALATTPPEGFPGKVVAMVNIDMVGRLGERGLLVGGVGSSPGWMKLFDEIGTLGIPTLYDRSVTRRSDHASFYRNDIPVVFFFTGTHGDYHAPGDEADAINRDGLGKITRLTRALFERLGNGYAVPFAPPSDPADGLVSALPGDNPATIEKKVGYAEG